MIEVGKNENLEEAIERRQSLHGQQTGNENVVTGSMAQYQKSVHEKNGVGEEGRATLVYGRGTHQPRGSVSGRGGSVHDRGRRQQARHAKVPRFPIMPDSVIGDDNLEERKVNRFCEI